MSNRISYDGDHFAEKLISSLGEKKKKKSKRAEKEFKLFREAVLSPKEAKRSRESRGRLMAPRKGNVRPRGEFKPVWFIKLYFFLAYMFLFDFCWWCFFWRGE